MLLPGLATAGLHDPEWNPPERFDHAYSGKLNLHRVPAADVTKTCKAMADFYGYKSDMPDHGCSHLDWNKELGNFCEVIIPIGPVQRATPNAILRHEVGHCNGWPGDHPN